MNLYFNLCLITVLLTISLETAESMSCGYDGHQSTGSVLFHNKKCWQHEDLALLSTRKVVQNLIPTNELDVSNDGYISNLIDYFHMSFSMIQKMSSGKSQDILLLALADAIGGYLHYYVIPVTKASFYCGNIRYDRAMKLFGFYEDIKVHLDTSGKRWTAPMDTSKMEFKTRTLTVTPPCEDEDPCEGLLINDRPSRDSKECPPSERPSPIPMPYLDDAAAPTSIAVPLRAGSLLPLAAPRAAFVLEKFFVAGTRCLQARGGGGGGGGGGEDLAAFHARLYRWLQQTVVPRLSDSQWYPAFGGVRKVLKAIEASGHVDASMAAEGSAAVHQGGDVDADVQDAAEPSEGARSVMATWSLLVAVGFGTLTAWLAMALVCACVRCGRRREDRAKAPRPGDEQYQLINTFVQIFYDMQGCQGKKIGPNDSGGSSGSNRRLSAPGSDRRPSTPEIEHRQSTPGSERRLSLARNKASKSARNAEHHDDDQDHDLDNEHTPLLKNSETHVRGDRRQSMPASERRLSMARHKESFSSTHHEYQDEDHDHDHDHDDEHSHQVKQSETHVRGDRRQSMPASERRLSMARLKESISSTHHGDQDEDHDHDHGHDHDLDDEHSHRVKQSDSRLRSGSLFGRGRHASTTMLVHVQAKQGSTGGANRRSRMTDNTKPAPVPAKANRGKTPLSADSTRNNSEESLISELTNVSEEVSCTDYTSSEEGQFINNAS